MKTKTNPDRNACSFWLYSKLGQSESCSLPVKKIKPSLGACLCGKCPMVYRSFKAYFNRIWFWLITGGDFTVYYTISEREGVITHASCVLGKCFKLPFMAKTDYYIGKCSTRREYRGQGIYPSVLHFISSDLRGVKLWLLIRPTNEASIHGAEKAGFLRAGMVYKLKGKYVVPHE